MKTFKKLIENYYVRPKPTTPKPENIKPPAQKPKPTNESKWSKWYGMLVMDPPKAVKDLIKMGSKTAKLDPTGLGGDGVMISRNEKEILVKWMKKNGWSAEEIADDLDQ